jgi:hypothetical protein
MVSQASNWTLDSVDRGSVLSNVGDRRTPTLEKSSAENNIPGSLGRCSSANSHHYPRNVIWVVDGFGYPETMEDSGFLLKVAER